MSGSKKTGLGRGFASLLPSDITTEQLLDPGEKVQQLKLDTVRANADQPRTVFDETALAELAASIKQHGVLQPIVVTPMGKHYEIVAGERRWRAAKLAGLKTVPALVRSTQELERLELALIENVQRVDLSPLEQAYSVQRLREQFNVTIEAIAARLGKAPSTVNNIVRLLGLPDKAKELLRDGKISEGHARQVLALKNSPEMQQHLLEQIIAHGWSVRQAERYVTAHKQQAAAATPTAAVARTRTQTPETKRLSKRLGRPVHVRHTAKGGRLEIGFASERELKELFTKLRLDG